MNKLISVLAALLFFAATGSLAIAQTQNEQATDGMQHHMAKSHQEKRAHLSPNDRVEAELAYIKTALKITPAQQEQWDAFANVLRKQASEREKRMQEWHAKHDQDTNEDQRPDLIKRLELKEKFLTYELESLKQRIEVEKPLYATLSPEQKAIADEVFAHEHGHHGRFGHHGMHHQW